MVKSEKDTWPRCVSKAGVKIEQVETKIGGKG